MQALHEPSGQLFLSITRFAAGVPAKTEAGAMPGEWLYIRQECWYL